MSCGKYILTIICIIDEFKATVPLGRRPNITAVSTAFVWSINSDNTKNGLKRIKQHSISTWFHK